ncbi:Polygalacturonase-like protein [Drosera capensis]
MAPPLPLILTLILFPSISLATTNYYAPINAASNNRAASYNIVSFGARAGGYTDSSKALLSAWTAACGSLGTSTIVVPAGRFLVDQKVVFMGRQCVSSGITFRILGTLVAPANYGVIGKAGMWISFVHATGLTISGGMLDGQGTALYNCKNNDGHGCPGGATTLTFTNCKNVLVSGLTSLNSQLYHIVIAASQNVRVQGVTIISPANSPNTDGIHVGLSTGVTITSTRISSGDDCISVGPGTSALWIQGVVCGPGHGISIGSLGKSVIEPGVQNVTVTTCTFIGTRNGVRIKTWGKPSTGFVRGVLFDHLTMVNVANPIIIDQNYCPSGRGCAKGASGVSISNVVYEDIHGTSTSEIAMTIDCSPKVPCTQISLLDVQLTYNRMVPMSYCVNADPSPGVWLNGLMA